MFPYFSILRLEIYWIYQLTSVRHGRCPALTWWLTFSLLQLCEENIAILGGISALICGICFRFPFKESAVSRYFLVAWRSCNSPSWHACTQEQVTHTKYLYCLANEASVPPSRSHSWCISSSHCICHCLRSTCLSPIYTPAARMLGKLVRLITAGVIMGPNVDNNYFYCS